MSEGIIFAIIVLIVSTTIYRILALKYQHPGKSGKFDHQLAAELADRDDRAKALEERVRVLEKIITETHKSGELYDEIERLKEKSGG